MVQRLGELARALELPVEGDPALEIRGLAGLEDARSDDLSFVTGPRLARAFAASAAGACIVPLDFDTGGRPALRSREPYADFARAVPVFHPRAAPSPGVHATAVVAEDATLGPDVFLGPYVVIGAGARIGARTRIHPHATLYPEVQVGSDCEIHSGAHLRQGVRLGDRVIVQSGAVLGAEGFGFAHTAEGERIHIPHRCPVEIGDDSEIGSNTTIDASHPGQRRHGRASSNTWIGRGVKIDNLVQVGHGCGIGDGSSLSAQVGLSGSTDVGRQVLMGGRAGTGGHLSIGDGALIGGLAGIKDDVAPGAQLMGFPSLDRRRFARVVAVWKRGPELLRRLQRLEARLDTEEP